MRHTKIYFAWIHETAIDWRGAIPTPQGRNMAVSTMSGKLQLENTLQNGQVLGLTATARLPMAQHNRNTSN